MGVVREEAARAEAVLVVEKGVEGWAAGAAACNVVPNEPTSRTSLARVRESKVNGVLSSRYKPGARLITTGMPAVASDCSAARATSKLQFCILPQLLFTA